MEVVDIHYTSALTRFFNERSRNSELTKRIDDVSRISRANNEFSSGEKKERKKNKGFCPFGPTNVNNSQIGRGTLLVDSSPHDRTLHDRPVPKNVGRIDDPPTSTALRNANRCRIKCTNCVSVEINEPR